MHPMLISGLASLGSSLLGKTFIKPETDGKNTSFETIFKRLTEKSPSPTTDSSLNQTKIELAELIKKDPTLSGLREDLTLPLTIKVDEEGRCLFKEGERILLACDEDSDLGKLGLAYYRMSQLLEPVSVRQCQNAGIF